MSATELAAVLCAAVALGATVALTAVCLRLGRMSRQLSAAVTAAEEQSSGAAAEATRAAADAADAARRAARQVDRLDDLIRTAAHVGDTVDGATSATFRALSNPVIKGAALASGTSRAARRLRGRGTEATRSQRGA